MAGAQDLFNQALGITNPVASVPAPGASQQIMQNVMDASAPKQNDVAAVSADKQKALGMSQPDMYSVAAGRESGNGTDSAQSPLEADLLNLPDVDLINKYGNQQGLQLIAQRASGQARFNNDLLAPRTSEQAVGDSVAGVGLGVANSLGGIGALGAGLVNDNAGVWAADKMKQLNDSVQQNMQSEALNARRQANQAQTELGYRDNTKLYNEEKAQDGDFIASLRRIGRDSGTAIAGAFDDNSLLSDGISQGIGSILTAGPIGKGLKLGAEGIAALSADTAVGRALTAVGAKLPTHSATMASIGLQEGGGAYQQTTQEAYDKLKDRKDLTEDQKVAMANRAGLLAAAIQAPVSALTGAIAAKFEGNPLGAQSLREVVQNVGKEGVEEYIQSGTGQLAQNLGMQNEVDPKQSLSEGVGEQAALGGIYGLGSAGAIQTPNAARLAVTNTASGLAKAVTDRVGSITTRNEQASPVADAKVSDAAQVIQESAPSVVQEVSNAVDSTPDMTPERKAEITNYVNSLAGAVDFDPAEKADMSPASSEAVGNATNRVDALHNMAKYVADQNNPSLNRLQVLQDLQAGLNMLDGFINSEPEGLNGLGEDHPARQLADGVKNVLSTVQQTPSIQKAQQAMQRIIDGVQKDGSIEPVTEENIQTPEGQDNAKNTIALASVAPEKADLASVDTILNHARTGKLSLTPEQRTALQTASAILKAAKQYDDQASAQGLRPENIVSKQIKTDDSRTKESQYSALQHAKRVRSAYSAGDFDTARSNLIDFQKFAQHMQNKVGAINTYLSTWDGKPNFSVKYQALQDDRTWRESRNGLYVNVGNARSIATAKSIGLEAQTLTDLANSLSTAFPELDVSHIGQTPLDPLLAQGTPHEVMRGFQDGTRKVGQATKQAEDTSLNDSTPVNESTTAYTDDQISAMTDAEIEAAMSDASDRLKNNANAVDTENFSRLYDELESRRNSNQSDVEQAQDKPEQAENIDNSSQETVSSVTEQNTVVAEEKAPTLAEKHPSLAQGKSGNKFLAAFSLPKTPRTTISDSASPLKAVKGMLTVGEEQQGYSVNSAISRAYGSYMQVGQHLINAMQSQLDAWAAKGKAPAEFIAGNNDANTYQSGKVLNIADVRDGKLVYNKPLVETAMLAGLHWALNANNYSNELDSADIGKRLSAPEYLVTDDITEAMNSGLTLVDALPSLAQKVRQYWGLSANNDAPTGYTDGIPSAVAGEILEAMANEGLFNQRTLRIAYQTDDTGNKSVMTLLQDGEAAPKGMQLMEYTILVPNTDANSPLSAESSLRDYPEAIEHAVMVDPENTMFFGEDKVPVAQKQLNSDWVPVTAQQKAAIRNANATPYFAHMPMVNLFTDLGEANIIDLIGEGDLSGKSALFNENYLRTLEGRNTSVRSAYRQLEAVMAAARNRAETAGVAVEELPHHYAHSITSVNRLQMLGKQNPQSSKLMREAIMSTWSTLDMNQKENGDAFMLGIAQALGVKVHNMSRDLAIEEAENILANHTAAIQMLSEYHSGTALPDNAVTVLQSGFKGKLAPMELQALSEYARLQNATDEERAAFRTPVYVEADGMTNGVINAISLMTSGNFTQNELVNLTRGGVTVGGNETDTANSIRSQKDAVDMYQATVDILKDRLGKLGTYLNRNQPAQEQFKAVQKVMSMFMPDVVLKADGSLDLKRGVTKNPLTVTLYGSSANGIAGKITKQIADGIYQMVSEANLAIARDPSLSVEEAMFPGRPEMAADFMALMDNLTNQAYRYSPKKRNYVDVMQDAGQEFKITDPVKFTLSASQLRALNTNVLSLFVEPMRSAIDASVGESVMDNTTLIRKATQVQSIYLQEAFKKAVAERVQWHVDNTPGYKKTEFLSRNELNAIRDSLSDLAPLVQTGTQNFFIAGSANTDVDGSILSRNLSSKFAMQTMVSGPTDSGVSGIAFLNIGMGDGQMIQNGFGGRNAPQKATPIFDGVNLALDRMVQDSQTMNKAVADSWQNNPLRVVAQSLESLIPHLDSAFPEAAKANLIRAVIEDSELRNNPDAVTPAMLQTEIRNLLSDLNYQADSIDARHKVIADSQMAFDQMAAVGAPHVQAGIPVSGSIAEKVQQLNARLNAKAEPAPVNQKVKAVSVKDKSGARVMSQTAMRSLFKDATPTQRKMFQMLMRTLPKGYFKVVTGNAQELAQYTTDNSINLVTADGSDPFSQGVNGLYHRGSNTIMVVNATPETVLHEMIHAATIDRVGQVLDGQDFGPLTGVFEDAVENIRTLMNDFLTMPVGDFTTEQQMEINHARTEVNGWLMSGHPVGEQYALNEFMAWSLANSQIEAVQRSVKVNPLVQLATDVVKFLKQLVFGRKRIPENAGEDMFSNLSFNTALLLGNTPSTQAVYADTVAFQNRSYGSNGRLEEINKTFENTVGAYLNADPNVLVTSARKTEYASALINADIMTAQVTAHGFPMSMQEASTYSMIVAALQTQAELDPNSLARLQELYSHVTKNLTPDMLMDPNAVDTLSEESVAQERYSVIMGNYGTTKDGKGRSSLLPSFFALATTNELLRDALRKMPLPKAERDDAGTLDAVLENAGQNAMDALSRRMSGEKGENVQAAIDALTNHIVDVAQNRETFIDQYASVSGGWVDRANNYMVDQIDKLSNNLMDAGQKLKGSHNKYVGALGSALRIAGAIATEKNGALVAEGVMSAMNKAKGMHPWFDIINDMVGRTSSNANVYDMIKAVRALVQQDRQQFRQHLPTVIADKFSRNLTDREWSLLHKGLGKSDISSLRDVYSDEDIQKFLSDPKALDKATKELESQVEAFDPNHADLYKAKMNQLADHMMNGTVGRNLLRNARAIAALLGERKGKDFVNKTDEQVDVIDRLTSLYALKHMPVSDRIALSLLVQDEAEGVNFSLAYLQGQRTEEARKAANSSRAYFNQYKGYIPSANQEGVTLIVADDAEYDRLTKMSFQRVADYQHSSLESNGVKRGYYFAPVSGRAIYNQGIMQNVRMTANGVDTTTGFTYGTTGGIIADRTEVERITRLSKTRPNELGENLVPVYGRNGEPVAYERSVAPEQMARLNRDTHFARNIGVWRGRQVEEIRANGVNEKLVDALHEMYEKGNPDEFVNVMASDDRITQDAVSLFTPEIRRYIEDKYGAADTFMVRRDMLNDALGYRDATVGDAWTGNSRWNDKTLKTAQDVAIAAFGNKAYQMATNGERFIQNLMRDARQMIIVKSVVVPVSNALGNIYQLVSRGVPLVNIARQLPRKLAEINMYTKTRIRQIELEAELRAADGVVEQRKINAEIQSITDSHKRLTIWPLIEAGEFSAINDASLDESDIELTSGRLYSYFEQKVNQLPKAVRDAGRYALITQDTPLFKALEKSVEYGDFISKAILFDDLVKRQNKTPEYALSRITEEFVNYDRLPGRFRSYMEKMGLMWFYNFKIRSAKVATSMLRNNPVHALMGAMMPKPTLFGSIGSPITDNIFTVAADGRLGFSMGIGQAFQAPMLNPWVNIMSH